MNIEHPRLGEQTLLLDTSKDRLVEYLGGALSWEESCACLIRISSVRTLLIGGFHGKVQKWGALLRSKSVVLVVTLHGSKLWFLEAVTKFSSPKSGFSFGIRWA